MKKIRFISLIISLSIFGCSGSNDSNRIDSGNYGNQEERIETLEVEIKSSSEFQDAEFKLFNVNGFSNSRTTAPGASYWDYKFAIKVNSSDLDKWTEGMMETELKDYNDGWPTEIIVKRKENWKTQSQPEYYIRKDFNPENVVTMIVFRNEGIIFKRVINT